MKQFTFFAALAAGLFVFSSCQKQSLSDSATGHEQEPAGSSAEQKGNQGDGRVFTLSNQTGGNEVIEYTRAADGSLQLRQAYSAGGTGTGGGLGSQGAIILSHDGDVVLAVNAGSNTLSSLKLTGNGLNLKSTVSSEGIRPISVTQFGNLVFVLNAGGSGNISGFKLGANDKLEPIPNSTRPLSTSSANPAQISFVNEGRVLVVTEKGTNQIISYTVNGDGIPGTFHSFPSVTAVPFGFGVGSNGNIYVSETAGGAPGASTVSSYHVAQNGVISLNNGPVAAGQSAACWVALTENEQYVYAVNAGSNSVSSFRAQPGSGLLSLLSPVAATAGGGPSEADFSSGSQYLYVLNGGGHSIGAYRAGADGSLTNVQTSGGLPVGAVGIAAR